MNVERESWLLPACGDRWLPCAVAEAFTVEQPIPFELQCMLSALDERRRAAQRWRARLSSPDYLGPL